MPSAVTLERFFRWMLLAALLVLAFAVSQRDRFPDPSWYRLGALTEPRQRVTDKQPFTLEVNNETYRIEPVYDYELQGVVVSFHDADAVDDIWHHRRWRDFLNVRDLCVVWGDNVASGVYRDIDFSNDSWTCWAYWPDRETGQRFRMNQISNNHLLADRPDVKEALMSARPGDHIRMQGFLANYSNPGSGFRRETSTTREDSGNGACETVYVERFEVVNEANSGMRRLYSAGKWFALFAFAGSVVLFFKAPAKL